MRRGMTAVEVLLAIGILASLLAIAAPWMSFMLDKTSLETCAERIGVMLQMARLESMTEGTRYRLRQHEETAEWQLQRRRLLTEKPEDFAGGQEQEEPEEPNEGGEGDREIGGKEEPGYFNSKKPWADVNDLLGARMRIRWIMPMSAFWRLEADEPGQAIFTGGEEEDRLLKVVFEADGSAPDVVILIEQTPKPVTQEQRKQVEIEEETEPDEGQIDRAYFRRLIFFYGATGRLYITRPQTAKERANRQAVEEAGKAPTYTPRDGVWGSK